MKSREHVTTNGRAVFFAAMWEDLRQAAISHGWALGLHGSLSSDMDIMAMPWDDHASSAEVMINQLCICFTEGAQIEKNIKVSVDKPNNRTVYTLPIWADFYLDINIITPTVATDNTLPEPEEFKTHFDKFRNGLFRASLDHYLETGTISGSLLLSVREYAQQSREQEREKVIQECIETLKEAWGSPEMDIEISVGIDRAIEILRKLKK